MAKKPRTRSNIGRRNQSKGKKWQKQLASCLAVATGLDPGDFQSNMGGVFAEEDVHRSREARRLWPFLTETKNTSTIPLSGWLAKLDQDCALEAELGHNEPGIIVFKRPRTRRAYCVLELDTLVDLLYGPLSSDKKRKITEILREET